MKLAIIGSRSFSDYALLNQIMLFYFSGFDVSEVVSGGARGADSLGARWANEQGVKLTEFIPDWDQHGKRAGFLRNANIIENADMVLCFWDGASKGTGNSLSIAKRLKKTTIIIYF